MEIMDSLTKERSQDIIITSVRSRLVDTTDFHQKNYISNNFSFPLNQVEPSIRIFLLVSCHDRFLKKIN